MLEFRPVDGKESQRSVGLMSGGYMEVSRHSAADAATRALKPASWDSGCLGFRGLEFPQHVAPKLICSHEVFVHAADITGQTHTSRLKKPL